MKIGIDARFYSSNFTGIGRYNYELLSNLKEIDKTNEYFIFLNSPEYENFQTTKNFHKVKVDVLHYSFVEQTKFLRILNSYDLDLMHFTHFNKPLLYNKKFIVSIHDLTLHFFPGKKKNKLHHQLAYKLLIKNAIKNSKFIIALTNNTKNDILKFYNIPSEKIHVVYGGIPKDFIPTYDKKVLDKLKIKTPFLLYTGVWREHKNLSNLIKAFAKIHQEKKDLSLVLTGKLDPFYKDLLDLPKKINIENRVIFTGLVSEYDLKVLYSEAEIFVFPSFYEGFGLPPFEAMACGTSVVSSNTSCMPEVLQDNVLYFDPYDVNDIASQILKLYDDKNLQSKLLEKSKIYMKNFNWYDSSKKIKQIYDKV